MQSIRLYMLSLCILLTAACAAPPEAKPPVSSVISDTAIIARVKAALAADPEIGPNIVVESKKGFVNLRGEVKTIELRRRANAIARQVDGVMSVENYLVIGG